MPDGLTKALRDAELSPAGWRDLALEREAELDRLAGEVREILEIADGGVIVSKDSRFLALPRLSTADHPAIARVLCPVT